METVCVLVMTRWNMTCVRCDALGVGRLGHPASLWLRSHRLCWAAIWRRQEDCQDSAGGSLTSEGKGISRQGLPLRLSRPCPHPASQALASEVPGR